MVEPLRTELPSELRERLAEMAMSPRPHQIPIDESRRLKREAIEERGLLDDTAPVGRVSEYRIPGPREDIPVRIYVPEGTGPFPALLWIHGGGFVRGTLDSNDPVCRYLTNALDASVVSVDYRLAPEHAFPAALRDCYAALTWVAANPGPVRTDPDRIAVGGTSAGGNLSAAVALLTRDRDGPAVAHQFVGVPMLDPSLGTRSAEENARGYGLTRAGLEYYWNAYLPTDIPANNPYAAPALARDLSGLPPATVVTAGFDPLRDEGIEYAERLDAAGVRVEHCHYPDLPHHISKFFRQGIGPAVEAYDEIAATVRERLRGDG